MLDYCLFFGLPIDPGYQKELDRIHPPLRDLFIQEEDECYLQSISLDGKTYLGKRLAACIEGPFLEEAQTNIFSLLRKLVPQYPYEEVELTLLAIPLSKSETVP